MRVSDYQRLLIVVIGLLGCLCTSAQGWEKTYGSVLTEQFGDVAATPDGGFIITGGKELSQMGDWDLWVMKTDADGAVDWEKSYGAIFDVETGNSIRSTVDGGYIIGGTKSIEIQEHTYMVRINALGDTLWTHFSLIDSVQGRVAIEVADGGYVIAGYKYSTLPNGQPDRNVFLLKTDSNGNELWWKEYGGNQWDEGFGLEEGQNGNLFIAGYTKSYGAGDYDVYVIKTNAFGDVIWENTYGNPGLEKGYALSKTPDGNYVISGVINIGSAYQDDAFFLKIDEDGNELILKDDYYEIGFQTIHSIRPSSNGFILAGEVRNSLNGQRNVLLLHTDDDGKVEWEKRFGGDFGDIGVSVVEQNGFAIAGYTTSFSAGERDGYLIKTDTTGLSLSNLIIGNIYADYDFDCAKDTNGVVIVQNQLVVAAGDAVFYGTTDATGHYSIPVPEGDYTVYIGDIPDYWSTCMDSVQVTLTNPFDTVVVDFSISPEEYCPMMEIDVSTNLLRRCFPSTYTIHYCNSGTLHSTQTEVELIFDPYLEVLSSSIPWTSQNGNTYTFDVGIVDVFDTGSFTVEVLVDCDSTVLGQTHCVEGHITPNELCVDTSGWDQVSIELAAQCAGDSTLLIIKNTGTGDMQEALDFVIIEDHIIGLQSTFQLNGLEDTTIIWQSNGKTVRMEADQSPSFPGKSQPSVAVEGCGGSPFSTGYVIQYPENDANPFVDVDCRENVGSWDPNDKQGFPRGFGDAHLIEPNTELEYLIRFQNTGTDTAFRIVIRDTLSHFLDITSVVPGASSHHYDFEIYGNGILKFTFPDIMLPDSNVNEPASHGFVKFKVDQMPNNPTEKTIFNSAAIYFDFNEPIITNQTYHNLARNFIIVTEPPDDTTSVNQHQFQDLELNVYPNPFSEKATFDIKGLSFQKIYFSLYDAAGREVKAFETFNHKFEFIPRDLPAGIYFFRVETEAFKIGGGKVILTGG